MNVRATHSISNWSVTPNLHQANFSPVQAVIVDHFAPWHSVKVGGNRTLAAVANPSDHNARSGPLHPTRQAEDKTAEPPQFVGICIAVGIAIDLGMVLDSRIGVDVLKVLVCTSERVIVVRIV